MAYTELTLKKLFGLAHDQCSLEDCFEKLTMTDEGNIDKTLIGEIAHIVDFSPNGKARADSSYPRDKINDYDNLILLCPTCHTKIDKSPERYSVEFLHNAKRSHEAKMAKIIADAVPQVTLVELKIVIDALAKGAHGSKESTVFDAISLENKISKNSLSSMSNVIITQGLARRSEMQNCLTQLAAFNSDLPNNLISHFKEEYNRQKTISSGDDLFLSMLKFATIDKNNPILQAASQVVLTYLFEICEIFEK